jgi:type I restriction enzyme S subunit
MSKLPSGWITTPIGSFTIDCEQRIPAETEVFKYIDIGSVNRNTKRIEEPQTLMGKNAPSRARKQVRASDVLVSMTRPNLNAVALVPDELDGHIASTGFDVIRTNDVDPRWIFNLVRANAFIEAMTELVQGALYPAVRAKDVRGFIAPLAPLNEQKRIGDKLDTLLARVDACRDRLDRIPAIFKRFRQSVLAAATSGNLTQEWREQNSNTTSYWSSSTLGSLIQRIEAGLNVKCNERPPEAGEIGLVKISAVTWGVFNDDESKTLPSGTVLPDTTRIKVGDFLISRANTLELVGACVLVENVKRPVYLSDKVLRLVLPEEIKPWLLYVLRSDIGRHQIETLASGNQLSMRNLSQANLKNIQIPMPEKEERDEIVRRVESLFAYADRLEARYKIARAQVEKLTPSLLAKAFRGELVPQDPNDEPASELLARIAAAKSEVQPKKRTARQRKSQQQTEANVD